MTEQKQPAYVLIRELREGETVHRTMEWSSLRFDVDETGGLIGVEFDHIVDVKINGISLRDDTSL